MLSRGGYQLFALDGSMIKDENEGGNQSAGTDTQGGGGLDVNHVGNFFAGIREDKSLNSDIRDASITTMLCHLGNMAQDAGETLYINPSNGKVLNNKKVMEDWWKREYTNGWEPKL